MKTLITLVLLVAVSVSVKVSARDVGSVFEVTGSEQPGKWCPRTYADPDCYPYGSSGKTNAKELASEVCKPNVAGRVSSWRLLDSKHASAWFTCVLADFQP